MRKILSYCLMAVSFVYVSQTSAGQWSCLSFDHLNRSYQGSGASMRSGMASARLACIHKASYPSRCRVSHNWCQQGDTPLVNANCEAEDDGGKKFEAKGKDACEIALYQCEAWQQKLNPSKRHHCSIIHG